MNIFITPRIGLSKYNTITLSPEQNWIEYAKKVNINLFIVSDPKNLKKDYITYKPKGLIVSGGGDIYNYDKKLYNLQRDKNEKKIIDFFKNKKLPILGICRGFQLICSYNGKPIVTGIDCEFSSFEIIASEFVLLLLNK